MAIAHTIYSAFPPDPDYYAANPDFVIKYYDNVPSLAIQGVNQLLHSARRDADSQRGPTVITRQELGYGAMGSGFPFMQLVVYPRPNKVVWAQWQFTSVGMKFAMEFRGKTVGVGAVQKFKLSHKAPDRNLEEQFLQSKFDVEVVI